MAWRFAQMSDGYEFESHLGPNSVVSQISKYMTLEFTDDQVVRAGVSVT